MYLVRDGDRVADCRLAFGSVAPTPMRTPHAEAILRGQTLTPELISQAAAVAAEEISPIDDVRSTAAYRRQVVAALTMDGINRAWERAARGAGEQGNGGDRETGRHGDTETRDSGGAAHTQYATRSAQPVLPHYLTTALSHYRTISLTVNGVPRHLHVADNDLLLNVLREDRS